MSAALAARVIAYVARGESRGKFGAQNRNTDGQGLSYGLIQWTQKSGSLGKLLARMRAADPAAFRSVFGPEADLLVTRTTSSDEATRMSLPLWQEPWTGRFARAAEVAAFQEVQAEVATTGASWKGALRIAGTLQVKTERALVLFFDRANHHGAHGAAKVAERLVGQLTAGGPVRVDYRGLLAAYASECAAPYRRASRPEALTTPSGKTWRPVGGAWHLFAGSADLYAIIVRRTGEILDDPALSDVPVELGA